MSSKRRSKQPAPETPHAPDSKQELVDLVSNLPEERRRDLVEVLAVSTRIEQTFSGPLPAPADFEHYNKVLPDAAHRIMAMAEKEQQIRADGQAGMLANDRRRINGATGIGLALIGVAGLATWLGQPVIALPLGLVGTVTVVVRHVTAWVESRRRAKPDD